MKLVINRSPDAFFSLSEEACEYLNVVYPDRKYHKFKNRSAPELVECVEALGSGRASDHNVRLVVVEIPDDVEPEIICVGTTELVVPKGTRIW